MHGISKGMLDNQIKDRSSSTSLAWRQHHCSFNSSTLSPDGTLHACMHAACLGFEMAG
jgi:hypothetical protein